MKNVSRCYGQARGKRFKLANFRKDEHSFGKENSFDFEKNSYAQFPKDARVFRGEEESWRVVKQGRKSKLQGRFRRQDKIIPASRRSTIINAIIAFNCREWQDHPSRPPPSCFSLSPSLYGRSVGGWKRKMAVNPVGGGYLNSAPLRASCEPVYAFAWDQATRTKLLPLCLILPAG